MITAEKFKQKVIDSGNMVEKMLQKNTDSIIEYFKSNIDDYLENKAKERGETYHSFSLSDMPMRYDMFNLDLMRMYISETRLGKIINHKYEYNIFLDKIESEIIKEMVDKRGFKQIEPISGICKDKLEFRVDDK